MKHADLMAAVATAYERFQVDTQMTPELLDHYDAMLFQIAFTYGVEWATKRATDTIALAKAGAHSI